MKPVLVSGIKPSGRLHVGNYLGALKQFAELQGSGKYECYFFIADLHAITEPQDPQELHKNILDLFASYLAAGIEPKKSVFFLQSLVPAHSEITWILNTITPMGDLRRMTQFKEKSASQDNENAGLFDYPVLMAGDVLLYDAQTIPVGNDQLQHLELARTLARKFNAHFGKTFVEPKGLLTKTPRVMSLKDPTKKMSKSQPEGCLFLDDEPDAIRAKIARAVTDSGSEVTYDPKKKPGLSNLMDIAAGLRGEGVEAVEKKFEGKSYAEFKKALGELVSAHFAEFRKKKKELLVKPDSLIKILNEGSAEARKVAEKKMAEVKKKVGLAL
ncbi:MAG TPA: tryptophan--tRNA ligase [Candidatus Paceibacterota bacterium]|jgi:tryptophanyl-tRNA synthetase|nr:tryptophan--tRNA ligase [Candidatus Paceibacterota bacterium]